ncbi:MAG: hypothetical protein IJ801_10535 [Lachnospiraceae bacterium]|nr:hypothetical protein [Lachnospiraceae bacterium]
MEQEERFAEQIWKWNQGEQIYRVICLAFYFMNLLWNCLVTDYSRILEKMEIRIWIMWMVQIGLLALYMMWFLNGYTRVHAEGRTAEYLMECVCRMPFSPEAYYAVIRKKCLRVGGWLLAAGFLIRLGGMLILVEVGEDRVGFRSEGRSVLPESTGGWLCSILVLIVGILLTGLVMAGTFYIHKMTTTARFLEQREGKSIRKGKRKKKKGSGKHFFDRRMWIGLFCVVLWAIVCLCVRGERLKVSGVTECYSAVWSDTVFVPIVSCAAIDIVQQLKDRSEGKDWDRKKIIGLFMVVLMATLLYQTVYDRYYDDRIEAVRPFWTREYRWEDVRSYTVKKGFLRANIQIELHMQDDRTLKVIWADAVSSEQHDRDYSSDYSYVAALAERLDDMGVQGTMEDVEKLEKLAGEALQWDENAVRAVREIEETVH